MMSRLLLMLMVLSVSSLAVAEGNRKARIIEYGDGYKRLEFVESAAEASARGTDDPAPPTAAQRAVTPRTRTAIGGKAEKRQGYRASGVAAQGADKPRPPVRAAEGVELIVGGASKDGVAQKTTVPVIR